MEMTEGHHYLENGNNQILLRRHSWISYIGLGILAYFLLVEHREHVLPFLPYLFLLACPAGSAYGFWSLVVINSLIFIFFAFSFFKPQTKSDWRTLGAFSAFIVAYFAEMYGFPLTIFLFSGWLSQHYPLERCFWDSSHSSETRIEEVIDGIRI